MTGHRIKDVRYFCFRDKNRNNYLKIQQKTENILDIVR